MSPSTPYDPLIQQVANNYRWPFDLLQAQVLVESSGDPNAFRYEPAFFEHYILGKDPATVPGVKFGPLAACSFGLLQILLETALELGFTDRPEMLFVPRIGLAWGTQYLTRCLARVGGEDYHQALQRYNGAGTAALAYADKVYSLAGRSA